MPENQQRDREHYGNPNEMNFPQVNGQTVAAVKRNEDGDIESFRLQNGQVLSYDEVRRAVEAGQTEGLIAQKGITGETILRSAPDAHEENNLDNMPTFE